jgi:signal transduction histidine kinase
MSLRKRTLLIIGSALIVLLGLLILIAFTVLLDGFTKLEKINELTRQDLILQVKYSFFYISIFLLLTAILFTIWVLWAFERTVLKRIIQLHNEVKNVSKHVTVTGRDELSALAKVINNSLDASNFAQQKQIKLLKTNRELTKKLILIQEDERKNLARELHDEFGQCLTAIQAYAHTTNELAQSDKVSASAKEIINISAHMYDVMHKIMEGLRPNILDELGLVAALEDMTKKNTHAKCQLNIKGNLNNLNDILNINLYRIVQECLNNINKHAQATNIYINISKTTEKISLIIEDNGKGINTNNSNGFGLLGMNERVQILGGDFKIENIHNKGVKIIVTVPN